MAYHGIDYGHGSVNRDPKTGIRYGIVRASELADWLWDVAEPNYLYSCPECEQDFDGPDDVPETCDCGYAIPEASDACHDEPDGYIIDSDGVKGRIDNDGDVWIYTSPRIVRGTYCSPCAPGAVSVGLDSLTDDGPLAYAPPEDWYRGDDD